MAHSTAAGPNEDPHGALAPTNPKSIINQLKKKDATKKGSIRQKRTQPYMVDEFRLIQTKNLVGQTKSSL